MRTPKALSYSALSLFEKDPEEYYLKYLSDNRPPRIAQTQAMAVGSAFDAMVKASLHADVFGEKSDPDFALEALFESQVEPQNRDWAIGPGEVCLEAYRHSGAYDDLLKLLLQSIEPPRFETTLDAPLPNGVPFIGKPDLRFVLKFDGCDPVRVILDWKVRQYCSRSSASPSKGFALCRDGYDAVKRNAHATKKFPHGKPSTTHMKEHKNYLADEHRGLIVNACMMEQCNEEYAAQVSAYAWQLGEVPGDEGFVIAIDELCCKPADPPLIRVANHKARVGREFQLSLLDRIGKCWEAVTTGHIFQDLTREQNDSRIELLDSIATSLVSDGSSLENFFNEAVRPQFKH